MLQVAERIAELLERDQLHEAALRRLRQRMKLLGGILAAQPVQHPGLGRHHEASRRRAARPLHHLLGRNDVGAAGGHVTVRRGIVHRARDTAALGMHQELRIRMLAALDLDVRGPERRVHVTLPHPDVERAPREAPDVSPEEEIRHEQDGEIGGQCLDDRNGVPRRTAVVRLGLHRRAAVHVCDHQPIGMGGAPGPHVLGPDRVGERAPRVQVGDQHPLLRVRDGRRLGHEVYAADDEHRGVELGRASCHLERVGDHVRHVLHLGPLIVVRQDGRPTLGLERADLRRELGHDTVAHAVTLLRRG